MGFRSKFFILSSLLLQPGSVFGALDSNNDGVAEATVTLLTGMNAPNGIAWHNGSLYVAEISRVLRFDDVDSHVLANKVRMNIGGASLIDEAELPFSGFIDLQH